MSYFDRLERKLKELEDSEKKHYDDLLKLQDLTHKAKVKDEFNNIVSKFIETKNNLENKIREAEKEKETLVHMRKVLQDKSSRLKSMISDYNMSHQSLDGYIKQTKKRIDIQYKQIEEEIYTHGDRLVYFIDSMIENGELNRAIPKSGRKRNKLARTSAQEKAINYFSNSCSRIRKIDIQGGVEFENKMNNIQGKFDKIKEYINNFKKTLK